MNKIRLLFIICLLASTRVASSQVKYEFRGVWIATVSNIDWPSNKFLSSDSQKIEFTRLLDLHKRNGMNAVIVQVRPAADAFYPSPYEPWSEWLTGTQGKPPYTYYDPLEFMIEETHKRGMEFHAWLNPYRAEFNIGRSSISALHLTRLHPEWFLTYGNKRYFDPGNKEVQAFLNNVVRDIVSRYQVDAIHFDDYFYPYRIQGKEFPDDSSYHKYGNGMTKADWRRSNVDSIIVKLGKTIKEENKYCKFGVSPFGVWRNVDRDPEGSNTKAGQTNYDDLYADILLWLKMKWVDYVAPQVYWEFGQKVVAFETLTNWWSQHAYERHVYIGHGIYRVYEAKSPGWKSKNELPREIKNVRSYPELKGSAFYSSRIFTKNPNGWNDSLQNNYYSHPALVPPMPWISIDIPAEPTVIPDSSAGNFFYDSIRLIIHQQHDSVDVNKYMVYSFTTTLQADNNDPANIVAIIPVGGKQEEYYVFRIPLYRQQVIIGVTSVNKCNNESKLSRYINLQRKENGWVIVPTADDN